MQRCYVVCKLDGVNTICEIVAAPVANSQGRKQFDRIITQRRGKKLSRVVKLSATNYSFSILGPNERVTFLLPQSTQGPVHTKRAMKRNETNEKLRIRRSPTVGPCVTVAQRHKFREVPEASVPFLGRRTQPHASELWQHYNSKSVFHPACYRNYVSDSRLCLL